MGTAVVVGRASELYLVRPPPARPLDFPLGSKAGPGRPRGAVEGDIPPGFVSALRALPPDEAIRTDTEALADAVRARVGRDVGVASVPELRAARRALPSVDHATERNELLAFARETLERALRTPEEILITLTREEERLERAVGREARAAEAFVAVPGSSLEEYAGAWIEVRTALEKHHAALLALLRTNARVVVPNLSAVVGERAAARLVSAAGGVAPLARMRAGRIQLLGTRRRPSAERGPRYGILYRAEGMGEVPPGRRGAYARSLGALAAIAVRADATTRGRVAPLLVARRDRRIEQLQRWKR